MRRSIRLIDCTLRDGSHAVSHSFTPEQARVVARALDGAGVPVIEIAHGDGLGGSSFNYGFSLHDDRELIRAAAGEVRNAKLAAILMPGIGVADDLREVRETGVTVARVATHCTEADTAEQHIGLARELGMEAIGFLMMSHMNEPARLAEQARLMESYGAQCVYVADSAGSMTMPEVRARVAAVREAVSCDIGFHGHHNLSLAVANSLVAIEEGATDIDGCLCGLGAGSGNCPTEIFIAVAEKLGLPTSVDLFRIMDVAEEVVRPLMTREQIVDRSALLLGYAGVTSSYLLHAQHASSRFGVDMKDILVELGRRKVVSGQEDMIVDVAVSLAGRATTRT